MGLHLMAAMSAGGWSSTALHVAYMFLGLGFVIFVHELGHFLVAKACGVKCEKFYLGFDVGGLRFFRFKYGETEYGIGALPLGGYVKMLGQDDNPANAEAERQRSLGASPEESAEAGDGKAAEAPPKVEHDPRSYQAKTVPKRMAIISAGVIMNLIFAVIFAAVAYRMGVEYTPCIIGGTVPGDAAWKQNWAPGTQIMAIGSGGYYDEQLRFDKDLKPKVILNGDQPIDLLVRLPGGEEKWISITPVKKEELRGYASLGIRALKDLKVEATHGRQFDAKTQGPALAKGDRITALNNTPVATETEFLALMYDKVNEKVSLAIERSRGDAADEAAAAESAEKLTMELAPRRMRWLGIVTKVGPVMAVRPNSPAEKAGFHVGDKLLKLDGKPIGDPVTLAQRVYQKINEPITVEVERADEFGKATTVTLTVTPEKPLSPETDDVYFSQAPVESLGLTYGLTNEIASVAPNSPAAKAGLKAGDVLTEAEIVPSSEANRAEEAKNIRKFTIDLSAKGVNWFGMHRAMQWLLEDTGAKLSYTRGEETATTDAMVPTFYAEWHDPERGVELSRHLVRTRTAESWGEAFSLGVRETKESMGQVLGVLKGIVTGQVRATDLGGPLSIATQATSEASVGISSLLIFLTLLSANLAIVNFLPIPVLDGGHFVFLTYEGLRGKPPNEKVQLTLTYFGLAFLLLLMVFVFSLDIHRGFTWLMG